MKPEKKKNNFGLTTIVSTFRFKEAESKVVNIEGVTFSGLKHIIDSIYKPSQEISHDVITDVLPAANLLQVPHVLEKCKKWMKANVHEENCFTFLKLADKFSMKTIEEDVARFIRRNFKAVSETRGFSQITKQSLIWLISSNYLKIYGEEHTVYKAARNWILANEVPSEVVVQIMSHIRFGLIPAQILHGDIVTDNIIDDNKECRKMISEATLYNSNVYSQPFYEGTLNKPRGYECLLIIQNGVRGAGFNTSNAVVHIYHRSLSNKFAFIRHRESEDMQIVQHSLKCVQINNFVFVFGTSCQGYQTIMKRYDPSTASWLELAPVPTHATVGYTVVGIGNQIFFMGGMAVVKSSRFSINPRKITDRAYVYDIAENKWLNRKELPQKLVYSAVTKERGEIFLTGGHNDHGETVKKTWVYSVADKAWTAVADMNHARCKHVLETVGEKLFAIGGEVDENSPTASIESYDPSVNQWTIVLRNGYAGFATYGSCLTAFVVKPRIYLVRGTDVHFYDVEKNTLEKIEGHIADCVCHASAYVVAPMN